MDLLIFTVWGLLTGSMLLFGSNTDKKAADYQVSDDSPVVVIEPEKPLVKKMVKEKPLPEKALKKKMVAVEETPVDPKDRKALNFKLTKKARYARFEKAQKVDVAEVAEAEKKVEPVASAPVVTEPVNPVVVEKPAVADPAVDVKLPKGLTLEQLMLAEDGMPVQHILKTGETLSVLANKYYGDSRFWPYIYEVNKSKLETPSKLSSKMSLYLPSKSYYEIDANSRTSLNKARALIKKYQ